MTHDHFSVALLLLVLVLVGMFWVFVYSVLLGKGIVTHDDF